MQSRQFWYVARAPLLLLAALLFAACGGAGGNPPPTGGGNFGGTTNGWFTVGGTVSGLAGTGLVLSNNGGDDLGVSKNGAFAFITVLANGATYDVTVASQPAGQDCTIANGTGTLTGADVTDVAVICAAASPPGVTRPTVVSTTPANGAMGVATNIVITVSFSEPMNCTTLTAASFTLIGGSGNVSGAVSCSDTVASFTPSTALAFGATYTATLSTAARDVAGKALAQNHVWTFTTAAPPDTTAPTVIRTDPLDTANGASLSGQVSAVFSEALAPTSVTVGTFVLAGLPAGTPVDGTVTLSADGRTVRFSPLSPLAFDTEYEATLTTAVRDLAGNQLAVDKVWRFNTGKQIAAGDFHTCARFVSGTVKCWGSNSSGQLGLGDTKSRGEKAGEMGNALPPVNLGTGRTAVEIVAGTYHTCARLDNGTVKCWGGNASGQLGLGDTAARGDAPGEMGDSLPVVNLGTSRVALELAASRGSSASGGDGHTCARLDNGMVKCWGSNSVGQLGLGDTNRRGDAPGEMGDSLPLVDLGGLRVIEIVAGSSHTCARLIGGSVKCWGWNAAGQLGLGDTNNRGDAANEMGTALPSVRLGSFNVVAGIAASGLTTCARFDNGRAKCWGSNSSGQLGLGDTANRGDGPGEMGDSLPFVNLGTAFGGGNVVVQELAPGNIHTCARIAFGSIKCWGYNGEGQLGLGDTVTRGDGAGEMGDKLPLVDLGALTAEITSGSFHVCARRLDNEIKCWGRNSVGQLGLGDVNNRGDVTGEMGASLPTVDLGN